MLSLLARAVVVSVHGHKQLSTAPIGIHLRSVDKDTEEMVRTILYTVNLALFLPALLYVSPSPPRPWRARARLNKRTQRSVTP